MSDFDYSAAGLRSQAKGLAGLMNSTCEGERLWRPEELKAIFKHQLAAPVFIDLAGFELAGAMRLENLSGAHGLLLKSFAELFRHPVPPIELLELTKNFGKANMNHAESVVPSDVASMLYYASIATAMIRLGARISKLGNDDLLRGFDWAHDQPWIDHETKVLFEQASGVLQGVPPVNNPDI